MQVPEDKSQQRQELMHSNAWFGASERVIAKTSSWSFAAKLAAAANLTISVPFVLHALGPIEFGAWATLVSFVAFAGFLDFGLGNGAMNIVAAAHGRNRVDEVAAAVHEARATLGKIFLLLVSAAAVTLPLVPWHQLLGLPPDMSEVSRATSAVVMFAIALAVPLNLATRVLLGLGRGDLAYRWQVAGQLATLFMVVLLASAEDASLLALTAATILTPLVSAFANTVSLLRDPTFSAPSRRNPLLARNIRREGLLFFVLQLTAVLAFSIDLPLISMIYGAADAGAYSIVQRLFSIISLGLGLIWTPLWPLYRQALASKNYSWVMRTLYISLVLAPVAASGLALFLSLGFEKILAIWVDIPIDVSGWLVAGFAVWIVVDSLGSALATFLNAAGILRYQVFVAILFATACLVGKLWAIGLFGVTSLPWITVVTYAAISLIPTLLFRRRLIREAVAKRY